MNVEIDEDLILREFDARLAAMGPPPIEGEFIPAAPGGWNDTLAEWQAAETVHQAAVPAWQIPQRTKDGWQRALGDLGDRYAPGAASKMENLHPALRLLYYTAEALVTNFDFQAMRFKPMKERVNPGPPPGADDDGTREDVTPKAQKHSGDVEVTTDDAK